MNDPSPLRAPRRGLSAASRHLAAPLSLVLVVSLGLPAFLGACAAAGQERAPGPETRAALAVEPPAAAWFRPAFRVEDFVGEERAEGPEASQGQTPPAGTQDPAATKPAAAPDVDIPIAYVSGEAIDVRSFLTRLWMRSNDVSREVLDRLVVENLALIEAERQEIAVSPTRVDERSEAAWKALGESLERQGKGVSIAEHLRRELGVDSEYYRRQLRREAILQMLAERVVRAWAFARPRCEVRLVELADQAALDAFSAGLAAGRGFDALAKELHRYREKEPDGAHVTLVKNDNAELSRLAFHTAEGSVAGPLAAEQGRHLMLRVEKFLPPVTGTWKEIGPTIEKSLIDAPVDDLEYVQWRAEMVKSYSVDLEPFFKLIGVSH